MIFAGNLWGAVIISSDDAPFPPEAEFRVADFADLAAQAIANAQAREELAASRMRIVEASDAERRRLERNLHDGAQQRLVATSLAVRLAARRVTDDPAAARDARRRRRRARATRWRSCASWRAGCTPPSSPTTACAPRSRPSPTARRCRSPSTCPLDERLPETVEAAAYFVVCEALTNVAKYAQASEARVRVGRSDGTAQVEVVDDGVGGADARGGSGLRGLADRVEALGGRLVVSSPVGEGTAVRAQLPVG